MDRFSFLTNSRSGGGAKAPTRYPIPPTVNNTEEKPRRRQFGNLYHMDSKTVIRWCSLGSRTEVTKFSPQTRNKCDSVWYSARWLNIIVFRSVSVWLLCGIRLSTHSGEPQSTASRASLMHDPWFTLEFFLSCEKTNYCMFVYCGTFIEAFGMYNSKFA